MTDQTELERLDAAATPGEWFLATSCSWRRILGGPRQTGVCVPTNHPTDNHPDLIITEADAALICHLRNNASRYIALEKENAELRELIDRALEQYGSYVDDDELFQDLQQALKGA